LDPKQNNTTTITDDYDPSQQVQQLPHAMPNASLLTRCAVQTYHRPGYPDEPLD